MKKIFAILIIFLICAVGKTATDSNNTVVSDSNNTAVSAKPNKTLIEPNNIAEFMANTVAFYQEKIRQLEENIKSQQKRIEELQTVVEQCYTEKGLQEALSGLQKDLIQRIDSNNILYKGKTRDARWISMMYDKFKNKMIFTGTDYIYIIYIREKTPSADGNSVIFEPLTKEQFIDALKKGKDLIQYSRVNGKIIGVPIQ